MLKLLRIFLSENREEFTYHSIGIGIFAILGYITWWSVFSCGCCLAVLIWLTLLTKDFLLWRTYYGNFHSGRGKRYPEYLQWIRFFYRYYERKKNDNG